MSLTPAMTLALTGGREVSWRYELYDLDGVLLGPLTGVRSHEISATSSAVIRTGGRLSWAAGDGPEPDWAAVLIKPIYRATFPDRTFLEWPVGLFVPATPKASVAGSRLTRDVELYDQLLYLDEDTYTDALDFPAGAIVTDLVRAILAEAGRTSVAVEDSALTLSAPMVWDGGTSRLRVINDLLAAVGYFSLRVDGDGVFRAEPDTAALSRPIAWALGDGPTAIITPEHTEERDTFGVPNRVVCVGRSDDGTVPPLKAVAEVSPLDPLHYDTRKRWVTLRYTDVDAASQYVLDGIATRRLEDAVWAGTTVEIAHYPLPLDVFDLNSRVTFEHSVTGAAMDAVVQSWRFRSETPALMETSLREIKGRDDAWKTQRAPKETTPWTP